MDPLAFLLAFLAVVLLGWSAGVVTGLAPGLHVNNLAALVLATEASWAAWISGLMPSEGSSGTTDVLLAAFLVAATMSHAILDFVPSVFFGAPSEETALSVLPGHRMLLAGEGARAVALAARGALLGLFLALALLVPLRLLLGEPVRLFEAFRPWSPWFLLTLLAALALSEGLGTGRRIGRTVRAVWIQLLAGALGTAVLRGPSGLAPEIALFPLFSGLFGMPGLVRSLRASPGSIPPQRSSSLGPSGREDLGPIVRGTLAGAAVSWLPGLSGGAAATLAVVGRRRSADPAHFMVLLGAAASSTSMLSVAVLFIIGRARSGTAASVRELIGPDVVWREAGAIPDTLVVMLVAAAVASALAAVLATHLARRIAARWSSSDPRRIAVAALCLLLGMILALAGPAGLVVAGIATFLGLVPPALGVRRVHLMASLLVPVFLGFLAA